MSCFKEQIFGEIKISEYPDVNPIDELLICYYYIISSTSKSLMIETLDTACLTVLEYITHSFRQRGYIRQPQ